jgi:pilus assembly protein CpaB
MLLRNLLLGIGALAIVIGAVIAGMLVIHPPAPGPTRVGESNRIAVLAAARPIPSGTLLREDDLGWRELDAKTLPAGGQGRGQVSKAQFVGAVTRRSFTAGEIIPDSAVIKPDDRGFLAAVLAPGRRAVTIAVDAAQSASGLVLPDDRVDVILVQDIGEAAGGAGSAAKKSVAQILLHNVRVVAVDRAFNRPQSVAGAQTAQKTGAPAAPVQPQTITLEVTERDAQRLFVAMQLGKVDLTLRALARSSDEPTGPEPPVWGSDVSPLQPAAERAAPSAARPAAPRGAILPPPAPIRIVRGSKVETP